MPASRAERLAALLLILGAFAVVLVVVPFRAFELDRFFLPKEVVLHATALAVALLVIPGRKEWTWSRLEVLLLGYLLLTLISAFFATNSWLALRAAGITWSGLLLFWSARELGRAGLTRFLVAGLAAGVVAGVLTALGQAYGLLDSDLLSLSRAPGGTFGNRNFVAHLAAIGLPSLIAGALAARQRAGYWLAAAGTLVSIALLVLTRSRAAWLATAAATTVFFGLGFLPGGLWRDGTVRRRLRGTLLAVVVGAALALVLPNSLDWRSDSPYLDTLKGIANYQEGSGRGRLLQWRNSLEMTLHDPLLGVGPGNWPVRYPAFAAPNDPSLDDTGMAANPWPSSVWVAVLSERGLPGFLLLSGAGVLLLLTGAGAWLTSPRTSADLAPLVLAATATAAAIVGAFDAVLLLAIPALYVWSLFGSLLPADPFPLRVPASRRARAIALLVVLAVGVALTWRSSMQVAAMERLSIWGRLDSRAEAAALDPGNYRIQVVVAQSYRRRGRCAEAIPYARQAGRLFPEAAEPRAILRSCGTR